MRYDLEVRKTPTGYTIAMTTPLGVIANVTTRTETAQKGGIKAAVEALYPEHRDRIARHVAARLPEVNGGTV